jgi:hypothetical protein
MFRYQAEEGQMICREREDPPHVHLICRITTPDHGVFYRMLPYSIDGTLISARVYSPTQDPLTIYTLYDRWGCSLVLPVLASPIGTDYRITIRNEVDANIVKPICTAGMHSLYVAVFATKGPYTTTFELTYIHDYSARTRTRLW